MWTIVSPLLYGLVIQNVLRQSPPPRVFRTRVWWREGHAPALPLRVLGCVPQGLLHHFSPRPPEQQWSARDVPRLAEQQIKESMRQVRRIELWDTLCKSPEIPSFTYTMRFLSFLLDVRKESQSQMVQFISNPRG